MNIEFEVKKSKAYKIGSRVGFLYSLLFIPSMIYLVFFVLRPFLVAALKDNVQFKFSNFGLFLLALLVVSTSTYFLLPKNKNNLQQGLKDGFNKIPHFVTNLINFVLLFSVYVLAIGSVSLISKVFGKKYLNLKSSGSTWVKRTNKKLKLEDYYRTF